MEWSTKHILGVTLGAVAGAALFPVVAPAVVGAAALSGVAATLGLSATAAGGAVVGGLLGHLTSSGSDK